MTIIRYTGKSPRMVHGRFIYTDDVRDVNPKLAKALMNDPDFVVTAEKDEVQPVVVVEEVPAPVPAGNVVLMPETASTTVTPEPEPRKPASRATAKRGRKK